MTGPRGAWPGEGGRGRARRLSRSIEYTAPPFPSPLVLPSHPTLFPPNSYPLPVLLAPPLPFSAFFLFCFCLPSMALSISLSSLVVLRPHFLSLFLFSFSLSFSSRPSFFPRPTIFYFLLQLCLGLVIQALLGRKFRESLRFLSLSPSFPSPSLFLLIFPSFPLALSPSFSLLSFSLSL